MTVGKTLGASVKKITQQATNYLTNKDLRSKKLFCGVKAVFLPHIVR